MPQHCQPGNAIQQAERVVVWSDSLHEHRGVDQRITAVGGGISLVDYSLISS